MKYIALWLGVAAALSLLAIILYAGYLLILEVQRNQSLVAVPLVILGIVAVATIVAVVEYLTENRKPEGEIE